MWVTRSEVCQHEQDVGKADEPAGRRCGLTGGQQPASLAGSTSVGVAKKSDSSNDRASNLKSVLLKLPADALKPSMSMFHRPSRLNRKSSRSKKQIVALQRPPPRLQPDEQLTAGQYPDGPDVLLVRDHHDDLCLERRLDLLEVVDPLQVNLHGVVRGHAVGHRVVRETFH